MNRWDAGKGGRENGAGLRNASMTFLFLFLFVLSGNASGQTNFDDLRNKVAVGSAEEKRNALFEIRSMRAQEASRLAIPALTDNSEMVRATAVSSVVFLPSGEAVKLLLPLLNDASPFVRRETATALGETGNASAESALIQDLQKEKVVENRSAAAMALGKIGGASAIEPLLMILKSKPSEKEEFVRGAAARSVGQIVQTIRFGKHQMLTPQNFLPGKYKEKFAAVDPLPQNISNIFDSATPILSRMVENQHESDAARREAAFALGAIGTPETLGLLETYLDAKDPFLVEICREAIINFAPAK